MGIHYSYLPRFSGMCLHDSRLQEPDDVGPAAKELRSKCNAAHLAATGCLQVLVLHVS